MASRKSAGVIGASSAALRRVIVDPLVRRKEESQEQYSKAPLSDDSINSIIEGEIIPRLLMAHSTGLDDKKHGVSEIAPSEASRFASLPLRLEAASLLEEVDIFLAEGVSVDAIYLDLLAPAARKLGEMWEADDCDFIDVTMGLWRLQEVMREVALRAPRSALKNQDNVRRVLFSAFPGDQHSFGALMMDEVFARAGWESEALPTAERRELLERLSHKPYDLAGLTISRDCPSAAVSKLISAMRSVSANPKLIILIGGRAINDDPTIVASVGADGTGVDARAALERAEQLVDSAAVRA